MSLGDWFCMSRKGGDENSVTVSRLGFENPSEGVHGPLDPENSYLTS